VSGRPTPAFAHASEAEMARILDFYEVRWEYEPHVFPVLWNLDGDVVESFTPDFWLPELGLYLEMTTLKQRLVRRKNRKLRRIRELYPDLRVKLFYARDFRALMLKYGRLALVAELSGTLGQVPPVRVRTPGPAAAGPTHAADPAGAPVAIPLVPVPILDAAPATTDVAAPTVAPAATVGHRITAGAARRRRARRRSARQAALEAQTPSGATA
jgi:hypoxanthine phosphoribosyltransferase